MALFVSEAQQQVSCDLAVELKIPGNAARISKRTVELVFVEGGSCRGILCSEDGDGSIGELGKSRSEERNTIAEAADSAFEQSLRIFGQRKKESYAGSGMRRVRDGVVIEAQARGNCETRSNRPLIADKPRRFVLIDGERGWIREGDAFDRSVRRAVDFHRKKGLAAMICGVFETQTCRELMRSCKLAGRKPIGFFPTCARAIPRLAVEKAAFCRFEKQSIAIVALRSDVRVESLVAELGNEQSRGADYVAVLQVSLEATLVKIRRRRLCVEGVQAQVVELLWVDREGSGGGL